MKARNRELVAFCTRIPDHTPVEVTPEPAPPEWDNLTGEELWEKMRERESPRPFAVVCKDGVTRWMCLFSAPDMTIAITVRPKNYFFKNYGRNPLALFPLEQMVYESERSNAVTRAMEQLGKIAPIPRRPEHREYDLEPYPEDFGETA